MIVLNLKSYRKSLDNAIYFAEVASDVVEESGVRIIVAPSSIFLKECADRFSDVFAQHVDDVEAGAYTGWLPVEGLKSAKANGSIINHSEHKLSMEKVRATVEKLHTHALESLVCASAIGEAEVIAHFRPTFVAIEPPELIGTGKSVSIHQPKLVSEAVKKIKEIDTKIIPLCGAGVSNKEDVRKALELGADGVLLASAFVNANEPKKFLQELVSVF